MKIVILSLLWSVSLCVAEAVVCNETCTLSQVCGDDGICYERSELVECYSWPSSYYCRKEQDCCGSKCMPLGADCCNGSNYCPPGSVCEADGCVVQGGSVKLAWWLIVIIVAVCVVIPAAIIIWKCKNRKTKAKNQDSRAVNWHDNQVHTSKQSTCVQGQSNGQPGNISVIVTDPK